MEEYPKSITKRCLEKILDQMNNSLYRVNEKDGKFETGFFCYIQNKQKPIPTLIINNYNKLNDYKDNIKVSLNNESMTLELGETKYYNKDYKMTLLEIKENIKNKIKFLEIDDIIYNNESEMYYNKERIYIIQWNKMKNISFLTGEIKYINKFEIFHSIAIKSNEDVSLIFNLNNNKLLGKHENSIIPFNRGKSFQFLFNEYTFKYNCLNKCKTNNKYKYYKVLKNEISILINADEPDINKQIYFLDNYAYIDNEGVNHFHDNLKELNELNTEMYIDDKKYNYKKYFTPEKIGIFNIKLIFNVNLTDCSYMFAGCTNILKIDFISFNTNYVKNMEYMFHRCKSLKELKLFCFDTSNVTMMNDIFSFCENLVYLDISSFNFEKANNMSYLFYNCYNLENLILSSFINKNVNIKHYMFFGCNKLNNRDLSKYNIDKNENNRNKYENEIEILIELDKEDIDKNIYFLNPKILKELNKLNLEIYINKEEQEFITYFKPKKEGVYNIELKFNINLTDCSYMFSGCKHILQIFFLSFNTESVTNMAHMFDKCANLIALNLSYFNTKNVIDMSYMFEKCLNLQSLILSSFDTKNVINMSNMFSECENLNTLDLSNFDTSKVINMSKMFYNLHKLEKLNLSSFNTKNTIDMSYMFHKCYNLNNLNLSSFNTENVINMEYMFHKCHNLKSIDLSSFNTKNVIDMSDMFSFCEKLISLELASFEFKNIKNISYMFYNCSNLTNLNLSLLYIQNAKNFEYAFYGCSKIKNLDLSSFNNNANEFVINKYNKENEINILIEASKEDINKNIYFLGNSEKNFEQSNKLRLKIYINNKEYENKKYFIPENEGKYNITLKFYTDLIDCSYMFAECKNIRSINFLSFNTKCVTNMSHMFFNCEHLEKLDLSSFVTKNVIDMSYMFSGCENLKNVKKIEELRNNLIGLDFSFLNLLNSDKNSDDMFSELKILNNAINIACKNFEFNNFLSSFNTKNVTDMNNMFYNCTNLIYLDLSSFDTSNVTDMSSMFSKCSLLIGLDLSSFDTKNVTNMSKMFDSCLNLNELDLSSFDTKNITDMSSMFAGCFFLNSLDLSSFDTKNVTDMSEMFFYCSNLNELNLNSFDTENVINIEKIFYHSEKLLDSNLSKFKQFNRKDMVGGCLIY